MNDKQGILQVVVLIIIILFLGLIMLFPLKEDFKFIISLDNEGNILYSDIKNIREPYLDIFSRSNPKGDFVVNVQILDQNKNIILGGNLTNKLGEGTTLLSLRRDILKEKIILVTKTYYKGNLIDTKEKEIIL